MKQILALCIAVLSVFAVISQFGLMLENSTHSVFETTVRFFSFFTILTNTLVAVYFTRLSFRWLKDRHTMVLHFKALTAITVYITIVGLVYQVLLRHIWNPTGLQKLVDEILHSVNPLLVIAFWLLNRSRYTLQYGGIVSWLIFPLLYLTYVLIRGHLSGFFPYPFLNVPVIGFKQVMINSVGMTVLLIAVSLLFTWLSRFPLKKQTTDN